MAERLEKGKEEDKPDLTSLADSSVDDNFSNIHPIGFLTCLWERDSRLPSGHQEPCIIRPLYRWRHKDRHRYTNRDTLKHTRSERCWRVEILTPSLLTRTMQLCYRQ